jgi:hypothetical protein
MRVLELLPAPAQTPAGWRHLGDRRRGVDGPVQAQKRNPSVRSIQRANVHCVSSIPSDCVTAGRFLSNRLVWKRLLI